MPGNETKGELEQVLDVLGVELSGDELEEARALYHQGITSSDDELCHYGILGMRWGVRRSKKQLARARGSTKNVKKTKPKSDENSEPVH